MFVPPPVAADAMMEAADAGIRVAVSVGGQMVSPRKT